MNRESTQFTWSSFQTKNVKKSRLGLRRRERPLNIKNTHMTEEERTKDEKISPDATCIDVENPQIAVPMKSASSSQPAEMVNKRVPTTHLRNITPVIFYVLPMEIPGDLYYPRLVARMRMVGDSQRERAMPVRASQ